MSIENPYRPPAVPIHYIPLAPDNEAIRREYLNHEASVKSIGSLYNIGGLLLLLLGIAGLVMGARLSPSARGDSWGLNLAIMAGLVAFGAFQLWLAAGLLKLDSKVRIPVIILSIIGLIGIPIGTLISAYVLYLLASRKGKTVFSDDYRRVILGTPHIKYKSILIWILLGLILLLMVVVTVGWFMAKK